LRPRSNHPWHLPYLTLPGVVAFIVWAIVVKLSGYVSLGSIGGRRHAASLRALCVRLFLGRWRHYPLLAFASWPRWGPVPHRANIGRLLAGSESKVGRPTTPSYGFGHSESRASVAH
jgi:glycerol-3-phosphate acyltransferase PlsY